LLRPSVFRDIVSARRSGLIPTFCRVGLRLIEWPYTAIVSHLNRRYDARPGLVQSVDVPVVSVGNLTLGGTGKTPMVHWIAERFLQQNTRVAVISRGYGAKPGDKNDEAMELEQQLPNVIHLQDPDRVRAAHFAVDECQAELLVLDDAFQHRKIARDIDVVMLDALEPFGFGHVFPRGTLREPIYGLRRADVVVLSRADMLDRAQRDDIRKHAARYSPEAIWVEVTHSPKSLVKFGGDDQPVESLVGRPVAAFCGIGNPAGFRHTLETCEYDVVAFREFADHHLYDKSDLDSLSSWVDRLDVEGILCTRKDLVKLGVDRLGSCPLWAVTVGLKFLVGQDEFDARLRRLHRQP